MQLSLCSVLWVPYSEYQNIVEQIWRTMTLQHCVLPWMQSSAMLVCIQTFRGKKPTKNWALKVRQCGRGFFEIWDKNKNVSFRCLSLRIAGVCMLSLIVQRISALLFPKRLSCPSIFCNLDQSIIYCTWSVRLDLGHIPCRLILCTPGKLTPGVFGTYRREFEQSTTESVTDIPWESVSVWDGLQDPFRVEMMWENKENHGSIWNLYLVHALHSI